MAEKELSELEQAYVDAEALVTEARNVKPDDAGVIEILSMRLAAMQLRTARESISSNTKSFCRGVLQGASNAMKVNPN